MNYTISPSFIRRIFCDFFTVLFLFSNKRIRYMVRNALLYVSPWHFIKIWYEYNFKRPLPFKYYLSLTICIKDEAQYIEEWLEYYLLQGVEHFYIYNNNGTDNTKEIIQKYIDMGVVTWIEYPGYFKQLHIYNHSIANFKYDTRWMGFIDIDEFIVPHRDKTTVDFLRKFEKFNQVLIHWIIFGSAGHIKKTDGLVIERFKKRQAYPSPYYKSIVNPRAAIFTSVHWSVIFGYTTNESGNILQKNKSNKPTANIIQINHYMVKSLEEYNKKINRGQATNSGFGDAYFQNANKDNIEDNSTYLEFIAGQINKKLRQTL